MIGFRFSYCFKLLILLFFVQKSDLATDFCTTNPCLYGGTCTPGWGTYLCQCGPEFFGTQCEYCKECYGDSAPKCFQGSCSSMIYTDGTGAVVSINNTCSCYMGWTGALCDTQLDACASSPCVLGQGGVCYNYGSTYRCGCADGLGGAQCDALDATDYCTPNPCVAGICANASGSGSYACQCQASAGYPMTWGVQCADIAPNQYCNASMCLYGMCSVTWYSGPSGMTGYTASCYCLPGWTGSRCDTNFSICATEAPCQNGGSCDPIWGSYLCTCTANFTGPNCTELAGSTTALPLTTVMTTTTTPLIATVTPTTVGVATVGTTIATMTTTTVVATVGVTACVGLPCACANVSYGGAYFNGQNLCKVRDPGATCTDFTNGTFACACSANFTGQYCDMAASLTGMLTQLYGNMTQEQINEIRADLQEHPPKLQDLIPFITGPMDTDIREALSWDYSDFFEDAAYERKVISFEEEFFRWNDVVLGNCFTFNHPNSSTNFLMRNSGRNGGLYVQLQVHASDYPYWVDTAAITVFVHNNGEAIFAESSRTETDYHRLGKPYGECAKGVGDVKSYYYTGTYTIDGCYRSCYQDLLMNACGCMDPRYPFPADKPSCDIPQRSCLNDFTTTYGDDPATLPGCSCPQPCLYSQFDVSWSSAPYLKEIYECSLASNVSACETTFLDTVKIEVNFKSLTRLIYVETPVMSFNTFLGNLGGILGVLCGISIVTFIEFAFLIIMLFSILVRG
ncbi:unnamed protein product, partial [Mesorhabditis belari]|uniref:EGF-like domain-containing protein n=1 Tax=Mesorhabditis belari TaxID=2138241 RepID=A0AAF3EPQ8_9BILA